MDYPFRVIIRNSPNSSYRLRSQTRPPQEKTESDQPTDIPVLERAASGAILGASLGVLGGGTLGKYGFLSGASAVGLMVGKTLGGDLGAVAGATLGATAGYFTEKYTHLGKTAGAACGFVVGGLIGGAAGATTGLLEKLS